MMHNKPRLLSLLIIFCILQYIICITYGITYVLFVAATSVILHIYRWDIDTLRINISTKRPSQRQMKMLLLFVVFVMNIPIIEATSTNSSADDIGVVQSALVATTAIVGKSLVSSSLKSEENERGASFMDVEEKEIQHLPDIEMENSDEKVSSAQGDGRNETNSESTRMEIEEEDDEDDIKDSKSFRQEDVDMEDIDKEVSSDTRTATQQVNVGDTDMEYRLQCDMCANN